MWRAARNGCFYHAQNQMEVSENGNSRTEYKTVHGRK